jgi:hypothetical protein
MKEALIEKLRPLGYTVSYAIRQLLKAVVDGRLTLKATSKEPE